jgi:hypothetical protein
LLGVFTLHDLAALLFCFTVGLLVLTVKRIRGLGPAWIVAGLIFFRVGYMALRFISGKPLFDQDVALYYKYGSSILRGEPVAAEYPELALLIFSLAALPSRSLMEFRIVFPLMTLPFGCLATYMIYRLGLILSDKETASAFAMIYALSPFTAIFWMFKFDEVAVTFALLGIYFMASGRRLPLGSATALGFLVKWFPILVLPAGIIHYFKSNRKGVLEVIGAFAASAAPILLLFHYFVKGSWLHAYIFHGSRPINGESLYYLIEYALTGKLIRPSSGANPVYITNDVVLIVASAAVILWLIYLAATVKGDNLIFLSALTIMFAVMFNKVYSTQFIIWLIPAILICAAQLPSRIRLAYGGLTATALQILNYLKMPMLSDTPWWVIPSLFFWTINIASVAVLAWRACRMTATIPELSRRPGWLGCGSPFRDGG